jgi:1-acylglycerone phosphate reductase
MTAKKTVLITGCSKGGLGDSLACAFHSRGYRVIATARNLSKIAHFTSQGVETLTLDVTSQSSIAECVSRVSSLTGGRLDILLNNSGGGYSMPLVDASLDDARKLFDLNVWPILAVTQAFLPLLLKSEHGGMIVNHTSLVSVFPIPMTGIYNASKAAAAMLTENLRLELAPFHIKVVELKTGAVRSNFFNNQGGGAQPSLPEHSIYQPAKAEVEKSMQGRNVEANSIDADKWAEQVATDLLKKSPPIRVWRGGNAWLVWFARRFLPFTFLDSTLEKLGGLDALKAAIGRAT